MKSITHKSSLLDQIENSHLVDTLPYIDPWSEDLRLKVESLVKAEQSTFVPKDYLASYRTDFKTFSPFPTQSFEISTPVQTDEYFFLTQSEKLSLKLEYAQSQKINLEIINDYTEESYKNHISALESFSNKLDQDITRLETRSLDLNKQRKILQESKNSELQTLQQTWKIQIGKNLALKEKLANKQKILSSLKP